MRKKRGALEAKKDIFYLEKRKESQFDEILIVVMRRFDSFPPAVNFSFSIITAIPLSHHFSQL